MHSPFLISKNESEEDNTTFMFDVAQDQRTVLVLSLLQSNNVTIQEAPAPLIIRVPRNVNISYTIGTLLVFDNITVFYLEHDTHQLCLECNHHENGTVASGSVFMD